MKTLIFEEHCSVLAEWWSRRLRGQTLVYLDAHLDLQFVNAERLSHLEQCTSLEMVCDLEKPHHLLPDRHYSYSIEDFLYPARRLGIVDRLIWVAPPHVETGYSEAVVNQLQQMDAVLVEEIASFKKASGGWIEGRLLDLDIVICAYPQLEKMTLPLDCLIDIDIDYFVTVPGDEAWLNPRTVFEFLDQLPINPELITLSRSVNSGFTPLRYRFIADYLDALWAHRHHDVAHYERLFHLEGRLRTNDREEVNEECQQELERFPRCAASYYLLSRSERDPEQAKQYRRQAADLCTAYRPSLLRSACGCLSRQSPALQLSTAETLERQLTDNSVSQEEYLLTRVALGLIYCACGKFDRALTHDEVTEQELACHPELSLEIGKLLLQSQPERASSFLEAALHADKTRSAAHVFLAQFYGHRGSLHEALQHLETALAMAPAWGQLLLMLAAIHERLGNRQQSQILREEYRDQQLKMELLARRLSEQRESESPI